MAAREQYGQCRNLNRRGQRRCGRQACFRQRPDQRQVQCQIKRHRRQRHPQRRHSIAHGIKPSTITGNAQYAHTPLPKTAIIRPVRAVSSAVN